MEKEVINEQEVMNAAADGDLIGEPISFEKVRIDYPIPGRKYQHYKGGVYEVLTLATHTETNEHMVVYKSLLFGTIYVRPLSIWSEDVKGDKGKHSKVRRFQLI